MFSFIGVSTNEKHFLVIYNPWEHCMASWEERKVPAAHP